MKLDYIEMAGFRGFRDKLRLDFSSGFTVISGRNGVGKSTICDAVEFAISGEIRKYRVEKANQESFSDYIWWRGSGSAPEHYVRIGFVDDDSVRHEVVRSREDGLQADVDFLIGILCDRQSAPQDPLIQLCKTSIIRDEWIAAQSLDLKETERFDFVSAALGEVETSDYGEKAKKVLKAAEEEFARAESIYQEARSELSSTLATLSEERSRALEAGSLSAALESIKKFIPKLPEAIPDAIDAAHRFIGDSRERIAALDAVAAEARAILLENDAIRAQDYVARRDALAREAETIISAQLELGSQIAEATNRLKAAEAANKLSAAISKLVEGGEAAGLHNGSCPLCAASRTQEEFQVGLALARSRAGELGATFASARDSLEKLEMRQQSTIKRLSNLQTELTEIARKIQELKERELEQAATLTDLNVDKDHIQDADAILRVLNRARNEMIEVERNVATLENSHAAARIADLEVLVEKLRESAEAASQEVDRRKKAVLAAKAFDHAVKRNRGEIVDERLAAIRPLLTELYQRLRPHSDWKSIDYGIRGEIRRFLSLRVGEDLNPQFVFSSGQRRVAGIAFLLSVHLARPWSRLKSLLLDDPVQHIDDFRAIHLVELLAALGRDGRQIICTVEDPSLGALLTRRLSSTPDAPGLRYDLHRNRLGAASFSRKDITSVPANVINFAAEN